LMKQQRCGGRIRTRTHCIQHHSVSPQALDAPLPSLPSRSSVRSKPSGNGCLSSSRKPSSRSISRFSATLARTSVNTFPGTHRSGTK
jgi:hypothetical protein